MGHDCKHYIKFIKLLQIYNEKNQIFTYLMQNGKVCGELSATPSIHRSIQFPTLKVKYIIYSLVGFSHHQSYSLPNGII